MNPDIINKAMVANQERRQRTYLGPSAWKSCDAAMWFAFRRVSGVIEHKAETLRTFQIGHALEECMVEWLETAGVTVGAREAQLKNQWGGVLGHIDGIAVIDGEFYLLEMKTANSKRFKDMVKKGIPDYYYAQIQIYMYNSNQLSEHGRKLEKCLYVITNKDTSELNVFIVDADDNYGEMETERLHNIIASDAMPAKEETYKCNFCDHSAVCKGDVPAAIDCRTCANVSIKDGQFVCSLNKPLSVCDHHVYHPHLMGLMGYEVQSVDADNLAINYGKFWMAPEKYHVYEQPTFTSREFIDALRSGFVDDELGMMIKAEFAARAIFDDSPEGEAPF